jgi:alkanesulfonate monooxygenase SsuD/methylene tetrahydromethanopterin reductase-like flavin-dependent oxidoreductase (luciferase family)
MAQQAAAVAAAFGENGPAFTLGVGVSHRPGIEALGYTYDRPAAHMRDYLEQLNKLFSSERSPFKGQVLVAALAPLMLDATGELASGSITWMANEKAIGDLIAPRMAKAAERAGRPAPRVVAGLPIAVTDDVDEARAVAAKTFAGYGMLPNYQHVLERGGASGPADVAVVGDEATVAAKLQSYVDAGATDIWAAIYPVGEDRSASRNRTRELLKSLF